MEEALDLSFDRLLMMMNVRVQLYNINFSVSEFCIEGHRKENSSFFKISAILR